MFFNSFLDDKALATFAEDNFTFVAQLVQVFFHRVENIVGKGENTCYHDCHQSFAKIFVMFRDSNQQLHGLKSGMISY